MRRSIVAAVAALIGLMPPVFAAAQSPTAEPSIDAAVISFTPFNDPATPFRFEISVANTGPVPIDDARIRLTIYQRVLTRSALRASLQGRPQTGVAGVTSEPLGEPLVAGVPVTISVERDLAQVDGTFRARRGSRDGVHPVRIQIEGAGKDLWTGWSALVFLPAPPAERLNVTWILPVHHEALFDPDGSYPAGGVDRTMGPAGTLSAAIDAAASAAGLPATLAPSGLLADQLTDLADGFARRSAAGTVQSIASDAIPKAAAAALQRLSDAVEPEAVAMAAMPYSRANVVSLVHAEMGNDVGKQITVGASAVGAALGRGPDATVFVPADLTIDSRAAAAVAGSGVRAVVLDPAVLPPQSGPFGPDRPVRVSGRRGVTMDALLADEGIRTHLDDATRDDADAVLAAQSALAETASAWLERPTLADGRAIVIATGVTPPAATIRALRAGLAAAPWLTMRSAADLLRAVPPEEEPQPLPLGTIGPREEMQTLLTARRAIDILTRVIVSHDGPAADLDRLVLTAESADFAGTEKGLAMARAAKSAADELVGKISAAPRRVTLTSRTGQLPVTVLNETGYVIAVRLRLISSKVEFPEGAEQTIEIPGRSATITIPAKAIATGAFGVKIELRTPDGTFPIGDDELVVRSTAVSAVALVAVGGGILVLLATWFRRAGKRRRGAPGVGREKAPRTAEGPQPA